MNYVDCCKEQAFACEKCNVIRGWNKTKECSVEIKSNNPEDPYFIKTGTLGISVNANFVGFISSEADLDRNRAPRETFQFSCDLLKDEPKACPAFPARPKIAKHNMAVVMPMPIPDLIKTTLDDVNAEPFTLTIHSPDQSYQTIARHGEVRRGPNVGKWRSAQFCFDKISNP